MASKHWVILKKHVATAFAALREKGINARGPVGFDKAEAVQKVSQPDTYRGFAFYHSQDASRARKGQVLWIGFGCTGSRPSAAEANEIGRTVRDALLQEGLFVEWSGSAKDRLAVYPSAEAATTAKDAAIAERQGRAVAGLELQSSRPRESPFFDQLRGALEALAQDGKISLFFGKQLSYAERQREASASKKTVVACPSKFVPDWDKINIDVLTYPTEHDKGGVRGIADSLRAAGFKVSLVHESYIHIKVMR